MSTRRNEEVHLNIASNNDDNPDSDEKSFEESEEEQIIDLDQVIEQQEKENAENKNQQLNAENQDASQINKVESEKLENISEIKKDDNGEIDLVSKNEMSHFSNQIEKEDENLLLNEQMSSERTNAMLEKLYPDDADKNHGYIHSSSRNNFSKMNQSENKMGRTVFTRVKNNLSKMTEKLYEKCAMGSKNKVNVYDYLAFDEPVKRFLDKNEHVNNSKKITEFLHRNEGYKVKSFMKKQENLEKNRQRTIIIPTGQNKEGKREERRNLQEFLTDQNKFVSTRNTKLVELKSQQTLKEHNLYQPLKLSASTNRLASTKRKEDGNKSIHERLNKAALNKSKTHKVSSIPNKSPPKKTKSISIVSYDPKKQPSSKINNISPIKQNQRKNTGDSNKAKPQNTSRNNIVNSKSVGRIQAAKKTEPEIKTSVGTSISSKLIILEKFIKNYELCLFNNFNMKHGAFVNYEGFLKILFDLGFTKKEHVNECKEETKLTEMQTKTFSKMTKTRTDIDEREKDLCREGWNYVNSGNLEKIDSNQILIFLSSISGLYDGEDTGEIKEVKQENNINNQQLKKLIPEVDFEKYCYSREVVKKLKISYKELFENRMNFIMETKKKIYSEKRSTENKDLTFKPQINEKSIQRANEFRKKCLEEMKDYNAEKNAESIKLQEVYFMRKLKKENELARLRLQKEEEQLKDCTFKPAVRTRARSSGDIGSRLHMDAINKANRKRIKIERKEEEIEVLSPTFSPVTTHLKEDIFQFNPLEGDPLFLKNKERYTKARIDRKIAEIQTTKGIATKKDLNDVDKLIQKYEDIQGFKFEINVKFNKNTIGNRTKNYCLDKSSETSKSKLNTQFNVDYPLFILDINIDETNKDKLEVYKDSDPEKVSREFCLKNKLGEDKVECLKQVIIENLEKNVK